MHHDVCLNIHYSAPREIWDMIGEVYRSMEYWCDNENAWKGEGIDLCASVEPGGLQISGEMPDEIWDKWFSTLKDNLSHKLGYGIGEPEDGFMFKYWAPFKKKYSDIKTIDSKQIVFNDYSTFFWDHFAERERDITGDPPYFLFRSPLIELFIYFDSNGSVSKDKLHQDFNDLQFKLNDLGITTSDLT